MTGPGENFDGATRLVSDLLIQLVDTVPDARNRSGELVRPGTAAHLRIAGPIGGAHRWTSHQAREQAARLHAAADLLDAVTSGDPVQGAFL